MAKEKTVSKEMSADNVKKAFRALAEASGYAPAVKDSKGNETVPERAPDPRIMDALTESGIFED